MMQKTVLVTGGTGFIGSHTVVELLNNNYKVIIIDNLSNSSIKVVDKIKELSHNKQLDFYDIDIGDEQGLTQLLFKNKIDAVVHFAALKAVSESVKLPLIYYMNNVSNSLVLFKVLQQYNIENIVFSSSATVYGNVETNPIKEDFATKAVNPYGWSKLMLEQVLADLYNVNKNLNIAILRYFNPVGAHASGLIGESPNGIPNNLMPYIVQVASGKREFLNIFGNDYPTHDGTGVRDYIHVVDVAFGHVKALEYLFKHTNKFVTVNLGTGIGYSVLDVLAAFEKVLGHRLPFKITERRNGDIATCFANPSLAYELFNWKAQFDLDQMCRDSWNWQKNNPEGY